MYTLGDFVEIEKKFTLKKQVKANRLRDLVRT